jgi:hypothetical protein
MQRARSSKPAPRGQRMRGSQSSKPRHVPDVTCVLPYGTSFSMDQESPFAEHNYDLSSTHSGYPSQGHVRESPWTHTGHENPPDSDAPCDAPLAYSCGDFPPSYATSMEQYGQHPPSYTASMESSAICSDILPWTADVYSSSSIPMDSDYDMLSENVLLQSSSGPDFTSLNAEVDLLPDHQSSDAMFNTDAFMPSGSFAYGNLPVGMQAVPNNIHAFQRTAVENYSQPWTHGQHNAGIAQQMPLTPPASDHGSPPNTQECSLSSQDPGHNAYDQQRYLQSHEGRRTRRPINSLDGLIPLNQIHRSASIQCTLRQAANLAQHHNQENSSCTKAY